MMSVLREVIGHRGLRGSPGIEASLENEAAHIFWIGRNIVFNIEIIREFVKENNLELLEGEEIKQGDFYIGMRNQGPILSECKSVNPAHWIAPVGNGYPYDTWECVKVRIL